MNIDIIKEDINKYLGKEVSVKEYIGRNKYEKYKATITNLYQNMFTLEYNGFIKSFTYSDLIIKNIILE